MAIRNNPRVNILTIDFETWYQARSYVSRINPTDWDSLDDRLAIMNDILDMLRAHHARATFFILAYNLKRNLEIVRRIAREGHEIALHGYYHNPVDSQTSEQFRTEIDYAKKLIEDRVGVRVGGFRAPCWSITAVSFWALDILQHLGFIYDSSMDQAVFLRLRERIPAGIIEIPRSGFNFFNMRIPFAGGGSLRLFPYFLTKYLILMENKNGRCANVYTHPWELDDSPVQVKADMLGNIKMGFNRKSVRKKWACLLQDFRFCPIKDILTPSVDH